MRDEMTNEHMTTDLCMTELTNCQRLSMGPNFIFFGGQKYGYRPIPTEIITSELAQLREVLGNYVKNFLQGSASTLHLMSAT